MDRPKISIIVPVYKVEAYLCKCINSIINQTYCNLEIILIDDGSPDQCGLICDKYAEQDERIRTIHKPNGGVSSARNLGLRVATGEWIGWVDADDWIAPDMFDYLLQGALRYNADIAVCSRYEEYCSHRVFRGWEQEQTLNTENALEALFKNQNMQSFLWDKLWKRQIFHEQHFIEGRTFEDVAIMHKLFAKAQRVVCLPDAKYYYLQRPGSIVRDISLKNRINYYWAARERLNESVQEWPQFRSLLELQCAMSSITVWCAYYKNPVEERKRYDKQLQEIAATAKYTCHSMRDRRSLGVTGRAILRVTPYATWWSFALARFFGWLYYLKHGRTL